MKKILAVLIILFLLIPSDVYAQEVQFAVSINPTTIKVDAQNGSTPSIAINLSNKSKESVTLIPSYSFFKDSFKHNGEITYIPDGELDASEKELLTKIKINEADVSTNKITLLPLETKQISLVIDLSQTKGSGDYYFSAIFTREADEASKDESASHITPGVGTNILLSIGDKSSPSGSITEFSTPSFLSSGPVPITLLVENDSKNTIVPTGQVSIKNMFGRRIDSIEIKPAIILSGSSRYMTQQNNKLDKKSLVELQRKDSINHPLITFSDSFMFGIYTADLRIKMGPQSEVYERSISFIILPLYLIIALTAVLFVALSIYIKAKQKVK